MCSRGRAQWRHLANTIEWFVYGCDAALCHITLTTCYYYYRVVSDTSQVCESRDTAMLLRPITTAKNELRF